MLPCECGKNFSEEQFLSSDQMPIQSQINNKKLEHIDLVFHFEQVLSYFIDVAGLTWGIKICSKLKNIVLPGVFLHNRKFRKC